MSYIYHFFAINDFLYGLSLIFGRLLQASNFAWYKLRTNIMWTKPAATEMRFGFEVTMYVMNK
jgi:pyrroloquinoline quinone biosynthesis protein A